MYAGIPLVPELLMLVGVLFVFLAATMAWKRKRRSPNGAGASSGLRRRVSDPPPRRRKAEVARRWEGGAVRGSKEYGDREQRRRTTRGRDEGSWETQRRDGGEGAGTKPSA
jgi:hypothetical protein